MNTIYDVEWQKSLYSRPNKQVPIKMYILYITRPHKYFALEFLSRLNK